MRLSALMVLVSGLLLAVAPVVRAADPTPEQPRPGSQDGKKVRLDLFGDPLPAGALARMGTTRLRPAGPVHFLAYSHDGKTLASGSWGARSIIACGTRRRARNCAGARDGKGSTMPSCPPMGQLWPPMIEPRFIWREAATGKEPPHWGGIVPADGIGSILTFSPDGKVLASACLSGIRLWEVSTGKELCQIKQQGIFYGVAFSPDNQTLAATLAVEINEMKICLWDATTGKELRRFKSHRGVFRSILFSPDGKTLASGSWDQTLRLWNVSTGQELRRIGDRDAGIPAAISPDSKILASLGTNNSAFPVGNGHRQTTPAVASKPQMRRLFPRWAHPGFGR